MSNHLSNIAENKSEMDSIHLEKETAMKNVIRYLHLGTGIITVLIFAMTGQYMDGEFDHLQNMEPSLRMVFRASHIYILMSGLLMGSLGLYITLNKSLFFRILQLTGSTLIFVSLLLFIYSFYFEIPSGGLDQPSRSLGVYAIFGGCMFHLFSKFEPKAGK